MNNGKYGPEIVKEICSHIANGLTAVDACILSNISEETFYKWKRNKIEFIEAIKKAEMAFKETHIKNVAKASKKSWQASSWILERKFQNEFAMKQKHEHTGKDGKELEIKIVNYGNNNP